MSAICIQRKDFKCGILGTILLGASHNITGRPFVGDYNCPSTGKDLINKDAFATFYWAETLLGFAVSSM